MKKKFFIITLIMALSIGTCFGFSSCGSTGSGDEESEFSFDPETSPSNIKQVVYLSGTPEDMGRQYGQQAKDSLERMIAYKKASAIEKLGSSDEVYAALDDYETIYEKNIPDVVEMWKGMAESSGLNYEDILIAYTQFYVEPKRSCSTVSMWGEATADGKTITGTNYDLTLEPYTYEPAVVAYPKDGNAFIAGSGLIGGSYMNEKGLIIMGSQGQDAKEEDLGKAVAPKVGLLQMIMTCDTAKQAKNMYIKKVAPGSGENLHVIDAEKNNYIVEHTMARDVVRTSGDFNEKDYMIATNGFLTEEMQQSLYTGEDEWDDWMPRIQSEERLILDNFGSNTIDTLGDALGCTSYYDQDEWTEDVWDLDGYKGFWTPENREPATKCIVRTVAIPEDLTMYVMAGSRDTYASNIPDATGNFWKLTLDKNKKAVTTEAKSYAQIQVWLAGRDIEKTNTYDEQREEYLTTAKEALFEGMNYENMAGCEEDKDKALMYYGKATTAYCKAQCYGQKAQNDPAKLMREGANYEIY